MKRMYSTWKKGDAYSCLKLYLQKPDPYQESFFQKPRDECQESEQIWYENKPLCKNKLAVMLKEISIGTGLYCVRSTEAPPSQPGQTDRCPRPSILSPFMDMQIKSVCQATTQDLLQVSWSIVLKYYLQPLTRKLQFLLISCQTSDHVLCSQ